MKIALSAALLGLAAGTTLTSISNTWDILASNGIFDMYATYGADVSYYTAFGIAEDSTDVYQWTAQYGLSLDASTYAKLEFNLLGLATYAIKLNALIVEVTPIIQYITFTRPDAILWDNTATYALTAYAEREVLFGELSVSHTPDVPVTAVDLLDGLTNLLTNGFALEDWVPISVDQWGLQGDSSVAISDSKLTFNIAEDAFGLSTSDFWYGSQEWYTFTYTFTV